MADSRRYAYFIRALRLPFVTASILPFAIGSLIAKTSFDLTVFLLGLVTVAATHLGANLINDYADARSGVDYGDKNFYNFFGGSKLIQEGVFSERFYLKSSIAFFALAAVSISSLTVVCKNFSVLAFYIIVFLLAWSYSERPFRFSYRRLGEAVIFALFGPAVVMGGYFIQTNGRISSESALLSIPFGLLTTAILFTNEIPDYGEDRRFGKYTWVSFLGAERSYILYYGLIISAFASIGFNIFAWHLGWPAYLSFLAAVPAIEAGRILKRFPPKREMVKASKLVISTHLFVSLVLLWSMVL